MSTTHIIVLIDAEIATLQQAHALIAATGKRKPGRPKATAASLAQPQQKRKMSPEGRARIAAAVTARWAAQKKGAK